jgi:hypothetical protein
MCLPVSRRRIHILSWPLSGDGSVLFHLHPDFRIGQYKQRLERCMWDVEQGPFTTRNTQTQLRRLTAKATSSTLIVMETVSALKGLTP